MSQGKDFKGKLAVRSKPGRQPSQVSTSRDSFSSNPPQPPLTQVSKHPPKTRDQSSRPDSPKISTNRHHGKQTCWDAGDVLS